VTFRRRCGKANCRCAQGEPHEPGVDLLRGRAQQDAHALCGRGGIGEGSAPSLRAGEGGPRCRCRQGAGCTAQAQGRCSQGGPVVSTKVGRWESILQSVEDVFTAPSFRLFCELMGAWVVVTARHTICQMVGVMDAGARGAHDAYHRFVRCGAWSLDSCLASLCLQLVRFVGTERLTLYIDDTLLHRNGPKVKGAAAWRDAVRSTARHVVYARGLNLVVMCVRVNPPWGWSASKKLAACSFR